MSSSHGQRSSELDDSTDDGTVSSDGSMTTDRSRLRSNDGVHLNFRLWLTTRSDIGRLIPGGCEVGWGRKFFTTVVPSSGRLQLSNLMGCS